jgi:hypothetical protein
MPNMVELVCEHGGHTWLRESQRGRRPRFCPEHKPVIEVPANPRGRRHAPASDSPTDAPRVELVSAEIRATAELTRLSEKIVGRLMLAGLPVPDRDEVDYRGFTFRESQAIHN